jgi:hypothetical protein
MIVTLPTSLVPVTPVRRLHDDKKEVGLHFVANKQNLISVFAQNQSLFPLIKLKGIEIFTLTP